MLLDVQNVKMKLGTKVGSGHPHVLMSVLEVDFLMRHTRPLSFIFVPLKQFYGMEKLHRDLSRIRTSNFGAEGEQFADHLTTTTYSDGPNRNTFKKPF